MSDKQVSTSNAPAAAARSTRHVDHVEVALQEAIAATVKIDKGSTVNTVKTELKKWLDSLIPAAPQDMPHPRNPETDPQVAPYFHQHKLDIDKANIAFDKAVSAATANFDDELGNWSQAKSQYKFAMGTAHATMAQAVKAATDAYKAKNNLDSHSRSLYLYYTMQAAVAAAIQDYEKGSTSAAAALATEAGALLAAHAAFLDAIGTAEGNLLAGLAIADQTYWQGVEQVRDAV